jgi:hypothetical protein
VIFAVLEWSWPITTTVKGLCRFYLLIFAVFLSYFVVGGVAHVVTALVSSNEVKQRPPRLVNGWVTVREYRNRRARG